MMDIENNKIYKETCIIICIKSRYGLRAMPGVLLNFCLEGFKFYMENEEARGKRKMKEVYYKCPICNSTCYSSIIWNRSYCTCIWVLYILCFSFIYFSNDFSLTKCKNRKAIVFIDGNNFYHNVKELIKPNKIDFHKKQKNDA